MVPRQLTPCAEAPGSLNVTGSLLSSRNQPEDSIIAFRGATSNKGAGPGSSGLTTRGGMQPWG